MKKLSKKASNILTLSSMALILVIVIIANIAAVFFYDVITVFFGGYGNSTASIDFSKTSEVSENIEAEGVILLKNENDVLPLNIEENKKVNVFGWSSIDPAYTGGGSGSSDSVAYAVSFYKGLEDTGFEYNTELYDFYKSYKGGRDQDSYWSQQYPYLNLIEPEASAVEPYISNAKNFSDTAIVFVTRLGGEHQDLPKTQVKWKQNEDSSKTYLDVTTQEEELLELVTANFENVIVVANSINAMNLGFIDDYQGEANSKLGNIDAALNVGAIGQYGSIAIGKILNGTTTPSGRTVDTYAYDLSTSSTYANSPNGHVTSGENSGLKPYSNAGGEKDYTDSFYIDYRENIYVGYKWYETADKMGFWDSDFAKETWGISNGYADVVQYPFGYGLSYTDFEWDLVNVEPANGSKITEDTEITIQVSVSNIGDRKGDDIVELYYEAPYNAGGIEKASKNLLDFDKTEVLDPEGGEQVSELLTFKFKASDMKSYDCYDANNNDFTGYELEKGEYNIYLSKDAHNVADMKDATITYEIVDDIQLDEVDGAKVSNLFTGDEALDDGVSIDGSNSGNEIEYMTRDDFEGTFPLSEDELRKKDSYLPKNGWLSEYKEYDEIPTTGSGGDLRLVNEDGELNIELISKLGLDYNAPEWDDLLDQITEDELFNLVTKGGYQTAKVESIGKPKFLDFDGPLGLNTSVMTGGSSEKTQYTFFPSSTVLAQSWNETLAYTFGLAVAYEAGIDPEVAISGWYAPACNIHRSPFGGRNFEYYSEDSLISGKMAANVVQGATNNGLYCYVKHFAINETASIGSSASTGLYTWLTEQAAREIYLKPFEIAVKEGEANAIMSAYNRIGATWCGGSYALLTGLLRDEWGFKGTVITDAWTPTGGGAKLYSVDQGIRAGNDLLLNSANVDYSSFMKDKDSATAIGCMRDSAHNILYTYCNTIYRQSTYDPGEDSKFQVQVGSKGAGSATPYWLIGLVAFDLAAVAGLTVWSYFKFFKKSKKEEIDE